MLIESETNNNPFTALSPIILSTTQPDPAAVIKEINSEQSVNIYSNTCVC